MESLESRLQPAARPKKPGCSATPEAGPPEGGTPNLPAENGAFGVGEFLVAAVVAAVVAECLGGGEVGRQGRPRGRVLAEAQEAGGGGKTVAHIFSPSRTRLRPSAK